MIVETGHYALVGHSQAATTHRYAHLDADPLRRAVDTIGNTIAAAMERGKTAEVVRIGEARRHPSRKSKDATR